MTLTPEALATAMGNSLPIDRYRELFPAMNAAMIAAGIDNANRSAAWLSQVGHESLGLVYMAEIATSGPGWSADRTRYRGRGPIQLTWERNYRQFGQWCAANGYVTDSEMFVEQPKLVEQPRWGFLAASWYWLNGGPRPGQINGFADRRDIFSVSRCVNGWSTNDDGSPRIPNGMADRQARWDRCLAMGDAIIPAAATAPPTVPTPTPEAPVATKLASPVTRRLISPSHYTGRGGATPRWVGVHTQEGGRTAADLAAFLGNRANKVSYNTVNDDREIIQVVDDGDAPWSAAGANNYALHHCFAGSYAGWSRGKWLETDASDGKNEDLELTLGAKQIAYWCSSHDIPPVWIGGKNVPPWGLDGICGHQDFGTWGGGHHDPGMQFPVDELIRRVNGFLATGGAPAPAPTPVPIGVPGTNPDKYAGVLLYRGRIGNDPGLVSAVQSRLKRAFASYAGHLTVDGDFGEMTEAAVREFQRRSGLVADGIVGPMTAAALKAW